MSTPDRSRFRRLAALTGLGLLAAFGCGSTTVAPATVAMPSPAEAAPLPAAAAAVPEPEPRTIENALLADPLFSPDGRYLFLGDLANPRLIVVELEGSGFEERALPFHPMALELSPDGRFLYAAGRGGVARLDLEDESSVTEIVEIPDVRRVTDLALDPEGDRLFLGDADCNCLYELDTSRLFDEDGATATVRAIALGRIYLESGPAGEIEVLPGGNRVLVLHLEDDELLSKRAYRRRSGAELSLIDTTRGGLVDWYWSQMGLGTGSILALSGEPLASPIVVAVEEDPRRTVVAYRVEDDGRELASRATTIASSPPINKPLNGRLRLVGSADRRTLVVLTSDERDLMVLRLDLAGDGAPGLVRQWTVKAPRRAGDAALSPDGRLLAVTAEDRIVLQPLADR